tara:strand:+ start:1370 stop:1630 length:261 start_codon:yes stop_codon:yes gene_type:complete
MSNIREEIAALNPEALVADGLDDAIVGWGMQCSNLPVVVYNYEKCVEVFMRDNDWGREEAIEWMEYNVVNAWHGAGTPIFMREPDE